MGRRSFQHDASHSVRAWLSLKAHPLHYLLKKQPQQAYQQTSAELAVLSAAIGRDELDLAYFDETSFSVNPVLRLAWARFGEQKTVFPQRHSKRFNVLGCLLHDKLLWQGVWARGCSGDHPLHE